MEVNWATILSPQELEAYWAKLLRDDHTFFNRRARQWWDSRTLPELRGALSGAWDANEMNTYVLARSYIAARMEAERNAA